MLLSVTVEDELALGDAEVVDDGDDDLVVSVIAAPLPAWLPAVRLCSVTISVSFAFCDELDTVNPSPSSVDFADAYVAPTTDGTVSCSLPLDTYTLMVDPCSI